MVFTLGNNVWMRMKIIYIHQRKGTINIQGIMYGVVYKDALEIKKTN